MLRRINTETGQRNNKNSIALAGELNINGSHLEVKLNWTYSVSLAYSLAYIDLRIWSLIHCDIGVL